MSDNHLPLTTAQLTVLAEWTGEKPAWWNYQNLDDRWGNEFLAMADLAREVLELRAALETAMADAEGFRNGQAQVQEACDGVMDTNTKLAADLSAERAEHEITRKALHEIIDAAAAESRADLNDMKCAPGPVDRATHKAACVRYANAMHAAEARLNELEARE